MANANQPKAAQVTAAAIEKHLDSRTEIHLKMSKFFHVKGYHVVSRNCNFSGVLQYKNLGAFLWRLQ